MTDFAWTDERCDKLRLRWREGFSASEIASEFGHGITRNAVIAKIHRLGLSGATGGARNGAAVRTLSTAPRNVRRRARNAMNRVAPATSKTHQKATGFVARLALYGPKPTALGEPEPLPPEPAVEPNAHVCTILQLTNETCRWPLDGGFYCGVPQANLDLNVPYCRAHMRVAFTGRCL